MQFIIVKTTTTVLTEVFEVQVEGSEKVSWPTPSDRAIDATLKAKPITTYTVRDMKFTPMEKR